MSNETCPKCGHSMRDHYVEDDIATYKCWHRNSYENNDFCNCTHGAVKPDSFAFYAVADNPNLSVARWYQTYSSRKSSGWVKNFESARIWTRRGLAQGKCTSLGAHAYLVTFAAGAITVTDQSVRLAQAEAKKRAFEQLKQQRQKQQELSDAERALKMAQERVERLKKGY